MVQVKSNVRSAEDVLQGAKHTLFVEGDVNQSLDPQILEELFHRRLNVEALGPAFHVQSAAEALFRYHPFYYFLIDRDHHSDAVVENSWKKFPDSDTSNLLIWRRREIENYFLIPEYLITSSFLKTSYTEAKLRNVLIEKCQERLYLDVTNQVIISLRENFKKKWVDIFSDTAKFQTKEDALSQLQDITEFDAFKKKIARNTSKKSLQNIFERILHEFTEGDETLSFGKGKWIERIRGKKVLHVIVNQCFKVVDRDNREIRGKDKVKEVVKDLLRKPLDQQPADFQELYHLIDGKISKLS